MYDQVRLGASKTRGSEQDENGDLLDVVYKRMEGKGSESIELVDMNFSLLKSHILMFQVKKDNKRYMKDLCTIIILTGIPLPPGCISILSCPRWIVVLLTWKCRLSIKINEVELSLEVDSQTSIPLRCHNYGT